MTAGMRTVRFSSHRNTALFTLCATNTSTDFRQTKLALFEALIRIAYTCQLTGSSTFGNPLPWPKTQYSQTFRHASASVNKSFRFAAVSL
jgi:hypothetical protein